jgi:hypothetical protein
LNRNFGRAAYVVGAALILIPMFDAGTSVLPLRFAESKWRYGTIGLLSNSLLIPLAGVVVVFAVALAQGHRRTLRALGVVAALSCAATLAALVTFALDALQSQGDIVPEMRMPFIVASSTAAVKLLVGGLAFALFALAGLRPAPGEPAKTARREQVLIGDVGMKRAKHDNATV